MKPYTPPTDRGRTKAVDDIHHRTADSGRNRAPAAKAQRHAARQHGKAQTQERA